MKSRHICEWLPYEENFELSALEVYLTDFPHPEYRLVTVMDRPGGFYLVWELIEPCEVKKRKWECEPR